MYVPVTERGVQLEIHEALLSELREKDEAVQRAQQELEQARDAVAVAVTAELRKIGLARGALVRHEHTKLLPGKGRRLSGAYTKLTIVSEVVGLSLIFRDGADYDLYLKVWLGKADGTIGAKRASVLLSKINAIVKPSEQDVEIKRTM